MKTIKLLVLFAIFILGTASLNAQNTATVVLTLERTPCFGTCPVYSVSIHDDGTVVYNGQDFVAVTGEQTTQIDPELVQATVAQFENLGYFDWEEAYDTQTVTDLPTITTSVTVNGTTHQIVRYAGDASAPRLLPFLEQWIDLLANTAQWTGVTPAAQIFSNGDNAPVITLQRDACFGFCPVYNVALFADGTGIYTGIANVDHIGVHVFETGVSVTDGIAQQANSLGYFEWQDAYDTMVMTDQATVITSIRWEDQFKQIVRYSGDPNAPVGLVWVEDSIDQVVPYQTTLTNAQQ